MRTYNWSGEGEVALAVPCPDESLGQRSTVVAAIRG